MATENKGWMNPSEIMTRHLIQRQSSCRFLKTKALSRVSLSRRHSFSVPPKNDQNSLDSSQECGLSGSASQLHRTDSLKRKNPFECDTTLKNNKRRSVLSGTVQDTSMSSPSSAISYQVIPAACYSSPEKVSGDILEKQQYKLLQALNNQDENGLLISTRLNSNNEESKAKLFFVLKPPDALRENLSLLNTETLHKDEHLNNMKVSPSPPLDWSIKTKARIVFHSSRDSSQALPGMEAKNLAAFVHHQLDNVPGWRELDMVQQVKRCCMHYTYPHLPWLSTFPRLSLDFKSRAAPVLATNRQILDSLQRDWFNTFTSVYQQLRSGICPYFYVCTHQFSVLFRCLRSSDSTSWTALMSPTTRGLRELLKKEEIDFTLPNSRVKSGPGSKQDKTEIIVGNGNHSLSASDRFAADENSQQENKGSTLEHNNDTSDDEIEGDDEASKWLEGMGLDKKDFPSLEPFKVKLQRESFREIDHRPQSLVYVEGLDVHALFNFLLNYEACIASSGPQHGLPPTILSPVPFSGGTLVQNMVKCSTLTSGQVNSSGQQCPAKKGRTYVFEISGPLLPHHTLNMAAIVGSSPHCESLSSISFSTHAPSAAFNVVTDNNIDKQNSAAGFRQLLVDSSQAESGLLLDVKEQLSGSPVLDAGTSVREMFVGKTGYSWVS